MISFLFQPPIDSVTYETSYNYILVVVSVLLAIFASFTALKASLRINHSEGALNNAAWSMVCSLALGTGIWAMHFVGMLALNMPSMVTYDPVLTMFSVIPSIAAAGIALGFARHAKTHIAIVVHSLILGAGIGAMHYTGMMAMRLEGFILYNPILLILSFCVAIFLAYVALSVRMRMIRLKKQQDVLVAIVLGGAVSGMHYTAMASTYFMKGDAVILPAIFWTTNTTAFSVAITTILITSGAMAIAFIDRLHKTTRHLADSEERWKFALEGAGDGVWDWHPQTNQARVSPRWKEIIGYADHELPDIGKTFFKHLHPGDRKRVLQAVKRHFINVELPYAVEFRMRCKDNSWVWILGRGKVVKKDVDGKPTRMIGTHTDITKYKQAEKQIRKLAFFDPLTELPNRTLFLDRLSQAMATGHRDGTYGALLLIDLDNFKILNDTRGHATGDKLLQSIAQHLEKTLREGDTVSRLGGDEFIIMLPGLSMVKQNAANIADKIAEKVRLVISRSGSFDGITHHSTASIGITLFRGHQATIDELVKRADLAMYKSKSSGRNSVHFFDPAMETALLERMTMEAHLHEAIQQKQFLLHYQVQVDHQGRPTGAEALVRWLHPEQGMISPADFIPLAEETGQVLLMGQWVLETACTRLAEWATRPEMVHLTISVNVSAKQFFQKNFVDQVLAILNDTGANPKRLKLELTESLLAENVEALIKSMLALKTSGIRFSLDDFGTGYSSLSYLSRLPLEQLKIDLSFVRDILTDKNAAAIARTIVALGESLDMEVIAEGVETEPQQEFLGRLGCHRYQGYLFSRPLPVEEFEEFVQA